jgi:hypothetical protein
MHINNIFQLVVPLTFLAIWALTSLFNREAPPLPPRTGAGRPQPPGGAGTPTRTSISSATVTPARTEAPGRDPTMRWGSPAAADGTGSGVRRSASPPDDEILIIEETRRSASSPMPSSSGSSPGRTAIRPGNSGGTRRGNRSRPVPAAAPRRVEPTSPRPLSGSLGVPTPIDRPMNRSIDLDPLAASHSPLLGSDTKALAKSVSEPTRQPTRPVEISDDFRLLMSSPSKLREAIVVNEILQPPLSLRNRRPGPQG